MPNKMFPGNKIYCLLFVLGITFSPHLFSQTIITGNISNESGKPIAHTSITYSSTKKEIILGFTLSDKTGNYKFTLDDSSLDSVKLSISCIGYKSQVILIKNQSSRYDFKLFNTSKQLPEVTVKSNYKIFRRGDTINYITDPYISKQDRVLGDVIKKLPGIEMNGDQILYQGKPLKKFYVEGLDLMGGRYGLINNNLPVDDVKKIQIIENDQPVRILDSLVPSDQASMNIVLKRFRTTGSGKAGIGSAPFLWDVGITPMSFFKNFQMINTYQANNTGNTVSDQLKYLTLEANPANAAVEKYVSIRDAGRPPFDESRWLNNNTHLFNSNILYKTKKGIQWKLSASYGNDQQRSESFNRTTIVAPENNIVYTEAVRNSQNVNDANAIFSTEKNEKNIFIKNQLTVGKRWNSFLGMVNRNSNTPIRQKENDETSFVSNTLKITTKWGQQLIGINSAVSYAELPQTLSITPGQFIGALNDSLPYDIALQNVLYKNFKTNNSIDFIKKLSDVVVNVKTGASFQTQTLQSGLQKNASRLNDTIFGNNLEFLRTQVYFTPTFSYNRRRWQITLTTPASWQIFAANYNRKASDSARLSRATVNPSLNIRYNISSKWEIISSLQHENDFGSQTQLYTGYILTSYNNLDRSTVRRVSEGQTQSAGLYLKYNNLLKSRFGNISILHSQSRNNYMYRMAYDSLGLAFSEVLEMDNERISTNISGSVSQYIPGLKTILKCAGRMGAGKSDQLINDALVRLNTNTYSASTEIINSLFDWLSAEYKYNLSVSRSHYTNKSINTSTIHNHTIGINTFPAPNNTFSINANYYRSILYSRTEQLLMNLKYTFTLPKIKTDFSITVNNLLNAKYFITQYNTAYMLSYSELYLRPRQVLASVRFNFK